jgi:hypothetical protein
MRVRIDSPSTKKAAVRGEGGLSATARRASSGRSARTRLRRQRVVVCGTRLGAREIPHFRVTADPALLAALPHPGPVWRDRMRAVNQQTALRSLAMEFTAIIVFTAIALWFVTEVGGENL